MNQTLRTRSLDLLDAQCEMTVASVRPDGFPQATTVGFVHAGLALYFACALGCQMCRNIVGNPRVAAAIDRDQPGLGRVTGLSLGGYAARVQDRGELHDVAQRMSARFPAFGAIEARDFEGLAVFRIDPIAISLLDDHGVMGRAHTYRPDGAEAVAALYRGL